jgi:transposase
MRLVVMSKVLNGSSPVVAGELTEVPDPEVAPRAKPRAFAPSYKARILAELDGMDSGERAGFLRREGLYSTLIAKWRAQASRGGAAPLADRKRGPRPAGADSKEIARLRAQIGRLEGELADSRRINDVQAKLFALLGELSKSALGPDRPNG